ncbi:hypothetical protein FRC09_021001 [Ceratobasidium sp. 395]|nr:hypothetical protein FRC09_021001 [Ceratobasidium sp. 395]
MAVEVTEEEILNTAVEDKRRVNTTAVRRSRWRKLEYVKDLEGQLAAENEAAELWRVRMIAAERMLQEIQAHTSGAPNIARHVPAFSQLVLEGTCLHRSK